MAREYADVLQKFLGQLGVRVITGAGYEPRGISDKVLSRMSGPLDFVVMLVTAEESLWTRDEIDVARSRGIAIIPIVESGSDFTPGVFGDLEYIPFESGHIGDAFLKLLEGVNFIRFSLRSVDSMGYDLKDSHVRHTAPFEGGPEWCLERPT